jgi:uncharacterized membrane protein
VTSRPSVSTAAVATVAVLMVLYAGLCKALLFRGLEYYHTDFFGFLEMSRSLFQSGELLRDNVYGHHAAIHNYYLMLAFSPLTLAFGAYGLVLGLVLLHLAAVLRVAFAPSLDLTGRVALLGACLGPIAYAVFDNPVFGFHPELCYPPLCVLLALDLREGRSRRAVVVAALAMLVKEDGAVLCACVLVAWFALRLFELRAASPGERRHVWAAAKLSLLAVALAFAAGMALLWVMGRVLPQPQETSTARVLDSLRKVGSAVAGHGLLRENLLWGLGGYAIVCVLTLLPLGRRLLRGFTLLLVASPPLLAVLVVGAGPYRFRYMLWPHRLAALLGLAVACFVLTRTSSLSSRKPTMARVLALVALSWAAQLFVVVHSEGYPVWARLDAPALLRGVGTRSYDLPPDDLRFLRCLGERLPPGLAVSVFGDLHPALHRQSIVFPARAQYARQPPRLRVVSASADATALTEGFCSGPRVGGLAVEAECGLVPLLEGCRQGALR